jgi:hypothetical protein
MGPVRGFLGGELVAWPGEPEPEACPAISSWIAAGLLYLCVLGDRHVAGKALLAMTPYFGLIWLMADALCEGGSVEVVMLEDLGGRAPGGVAFYGEDFELAVLEEVVAG